MEPYQMANDLSERIERETQRILKGCPICPECGCSVDTVGVYANAEYVKTDWDTFHPKCFKKWVRKDRDIMKQLADEYTEIIKKQTDGLGNFVDEYIDEYLTKVVI